MITRVGPITAAWLSLFGLLSLRASDHRQALCLW